MTCFTFHRDGSVDASPLKITEEICHNLEDNLLMFFTGYSRSASAILLDQDASIRRNDPVMIEQLHYVKDTGLRSKRALETGDVAGFGRLMDDHWQGKRKRSAAMSNPQIDRWYDSALANGAIGGKLIGAGGGGFLMFCAEDKSRLRHAMRAAGLTEVRFRFDFEGTKVIAQ